MKTYVAFLRGINVGGNTMLPMPELRSLCERIGFENVRTYIQSGNVIFESMLSPQELMKGLENALFRKWKKHIPLVVRTHSELEKIVSGNPFPNAKPEQIGVMLFATPVSKDFSFGVSTSGREEVVSAGREVYIHYPDGMGRSKLKLPKQSQEGTVRNMNTITKLVQMSKK